MTHDIDTRDAIISDLSRRLDGALAEVERLKGECEELPRLKWQADQYVQICAAMGEAQGSDGVAAKIIDRLHEPTAAKERAAIVAWLRYSDEPKGATIGQSWPLAEKIENGEHWPAEGKND